MGGRPADPTIPLCVAVSSGDTSRSCLMVFAKQRKTKGNRKAEDWGSLSFDWSEVQCEQHQNLRHNRVEAENSQSPQSVALGLSVPPASPSDDTYPFKTANASHASQASPHPAGTLIVTDVNVQC